MPKKLKQLARGRSGDDLAQMEAKLTMLAEGREEARRDVHEAEVALARARVEWVDGGDAGPKEEAELALEQARRALTEAEGTYTAWSGKVAMARANAATRENAEREAKIRAHLDSARGHLERMHAAAKVIAAADKGFAADLDAIRALDSHAFQYVPAIMVTREPLLALTIGSSTPTMHRAALVGHPDRTALAESKPLLDVFESSVVAQLIPTPPTAPAQAAA